MLRPAGQLAALVWKLLIRLAAVDRPEKLTT
jgi:hypothetical protein